jgi:hypothetical protein
MWDKTRADSLQGRISPSIHCKALALTNGDGNRDGLLTQSMHVVVAPASPAAGGTEDRPSLGTPAR